MKKVIFTTASAFLLLGGTLFAQSDKKEERKEIIIERKKGGQKEKMVIEIDGNTVTINGKPAKDYKGKERIVIEDDIVIDGNRVMIPGQTKRGIQIMGEKKALLGVTSESTKDGAKITTVSKNSSAEKAGLQSGDIITGVGAKNIDSRESLSEAIAAQKPGDEVEIQYLRDGKKKKTKAELGSTNQGMTWESDNFEFNFDGPRTITIPSMPKLRGLDFPRFESEGGNYFLFNSTPKYGMDVQDNAEGTGVKITNVEAESNAAKAGLQKDDIVTEVDGETIKDLDQLREALLDAKGEKTSLKIKIIRKDQPMELTLLVPKRIKSASL